MRVFFALMMVCACSVFALTEPEWWTMTEEAEAYVKSLAADADYAPKSGKTQVLVRMQAKYGLERDDFIHKWYDRPLHQDSSMQMAEQGSNLINEKSWMVDVRLMKQSGLDGTGILIMKSRRKDIIGRSQLPGGEIPVLVELDSSSFSSGYEPHFPAAQMALDMPNSFKLDGKIVLTRQPETPEVDFFQGLKKALVEKHGDKFIIMPYGPFIPLDLVPAHDKKMDLEHVKAIMERIRDRLRKVDGFFIGGTSSLWDNRYGAKFDRDIMIPIIHSIFSEPEFKGKKYLGFQTICGHENCYRWNYIQDSTGTRMLRDNLDTVGLLKPDFALLTEWDEENENTCFRPTVANGFSTMRLLRYYTAKYKGQKPPMLEGDDRGIPNLIVSYRQHLLAGMPLEIEVCNVPDGTFAGGKFTVALKLRNMDGKVLKSFSPKKLSADKCGAVWFTVPASEYLDQVNVVPELQVAWDGGSVTVREGLCPIELRANMNWDYKWVKQCLRDIPQNVKSTLAVRKTGEEGVIELAGSITSPVPLRSVEIMEGPDTVYMHSKEPPIRENDENYVICVKSQAHGVGGAMRMNGKIIWHGLTEITSVCGDDKRVRSAGNEWIFDGATYNEWPRFHYAVIPKSQAGNVEIEVALAPNFSGRIKLSKIIQDGVVAICGPAGGNMSFTRFMTQKAIPAPFGGKSAEFKCLVRPFEKMATYKIRAIDENYHVYYGKAVCIAEPTGKYRKYHVFEHYENRVTELKVDTSLVKEPEFEFKPDNGSVFRSNAGFGTYGIFGGFNYLVTGIGCGENLYSNLIYFRVNKSFQGWENMAPSYERELDGGYSLHFKDCNFVSIPKEFIPSHAGFEISMEIFPEGGEGKQGILSSGSNSFEMTIKDGVPEIFIFNGNVFYKSGGSQASRKTRGPALKMNCWNEVKVEYDLKDAWIVVNGMPGEKVAASGYLLYARHNALGTTHNPPCFFRGKIRKLKMRLK